MTAIATFPVLLGTGIHADRPAANAVGSGGLWSCTTHTLVYQTDGASWSTWLDPGGSGITDILDIPTAETNTTLVLAPDGAGGVEFRAETGGSGTAPIAFGSPYMKPATPGAMDEEWDGAADTLPTDWAWVSAAPTFHINSKLPGLFGVERADTTERKIRKSNFTMAATSGLWIPFACGSNAAITSQFEFIIYDSASSNGYGFGVHNGNVWLARDSNAGSLANRGTYTSGDRAHMGVMGVTRASNNWTTWLSFDGAEFIQVQSADARTFTVDRLEWRWSSDNAMAQRGLIGPIHYRTDNLFPNVL